MSKNVFLISDTHFGHSAMYERPFRRPDGLALRPFRTSNEADEEMVERWNAVVKPTDKIIHLGDVAWTRNSLDILNKLNGQKTLVIGNHENQLMKHLGMYFNSIYAYYKIEDFAFSHIPIHPSSLDKFKGNIHGHLHANRVMLPDGIIDARYFCACVEHIDYAPINWEAVKQYFAF